ncbi:hypothetical protein WJX74_011048 [Apatococcus lobatus]|uniref:Uncharacterized protein n=1 Tax=Apatococcus lobatus TaxID=904363 RepID=A0AAW1RTJ3_9CHLO
MVLSESLGLAPPPVQDRATFEVHCRDCSSHQLDLLRTQCLTTTAPFTEGYIWQREAFSLRVSSETREQAGAYACLFGSLSFGENSEDEWFLVWLLQQITSRIRGAAARIRDEDGEFLLIEAAHALPRWLQPDTSLERVWLHQGVLHVIPKQHEVAGNVLKALRLVTDPHARTEAAEPIQQAVAKKLARYPERARKNMHRARCRVPASIAHILRQDPQLVSPAVEAFYTRDTPGVKTAARMAHFPPQDWVDTIVKFNRCLYAQLVQQQYEAPPHVSMPEQYDAQFPAASLGIKLTAGFEILCSELSSPAQQSATGSSRAACSSRHDSNPGSESGPHAARHDLPAVQNGQLPARGSELSSMRSVAEAQAETDHGAHDQQPGSAAGSPPEVGSVGTGRHPATTHSTAAGSRRDGSAQLGHDPGWQSFKARLQSLDWFEGEMEGSKRYRHREKEAADMWRATEAHQKSLHALAAPVQRVQDILAQPFDLARLQQEEQAMREDSDAWMAEGPDEVDRELQAAQAELDSSAKAKTPKGNAQGGAAGPEFDPGEFARRMQAFVEKASSFEGAEVPGNGSGLDETRFCAELTQALGLQDLKEDPDDSSDEASSFFSDPPTDSDASSNDGLDAVPHESGVDFAQAVDAASSIPGVKAHVQADMDRNVRVLRSHGAGSAANGSSGASHPVSSKQQGQHLASPTGTDARGRGASGSAHHLPGRPHAGVAGCPTHSDIDAASSSDVATGTDSDDDEAFMEQYDAAMQDELSSSKLPQSFSRPAAAASGASPPPGRSSASRQSSGAKQDPSQAHAVQDSLAPVDLDLNLVQNLLESYSSQQGLPGPASNIAGLLGLTLPDDADKT